MKNLFSSAKIINHLSDKELIESQLRKMLGNKIGKGYFLESYYPGKEGLHCIIAERKPYSEEDYTVVIPWCEIDQWVAKESHFQYEVEEAFSKIREAYLKSH